MFINILKWQPSKIHLLHTRYIRQRWILEILRWLEILHGFGRSNLTYLFDCKRRSTCPICVEFSQRAVK